MHLFESLSEVERSIRDESVGKAVEIPPSVVGTPIFGTANPKLKSSEYLASSVGWVYACVGAIADEVANVKLHLYKMNAKKDVEEVFTHPILDVLYRANNMMTKYDLFWLTSQYLEMTGEAPWFVLKNGSTPYAIFLLRPDRLSPVIAPKIEGEKIISHYTYRQSDGSQMRIEAENVVFLKYPDPNSPFRGRGPLEAASKTIDIESYSEDFNLTYFSNGVHPSSSLETANKLNHVQRLQLKDAIQRLYSGRENAHKSIILENGVSFKPLTLSHKDMEFLEQMRFSRDKIMSIFRVPKTVLGLTEDVNRANAEATDLVFAKRTVKPKMQRIVEQLNEFFVPLFSNSDNLFLDFEDPVPEDVTAKNASYESALRGGWMTINEVRDRENLDPLDDGDRPLVPLSLVPLGEGIGSAPSDSKSYNHDFMVSRRQVIQRKENKKKVVETVVREIQKGVMDVIVPLIKDNLRIEQSSKKKVVVKDAEEQKTGLTTEVKEMFWNLAIKVQAQFESSMIEKLLGIFKNQKAKVLANLDQKAIDINKILLDLEKETKISVKILSPLIRELIKEQGKFAFDLLSIDGELNMSNPKVQKYFQDHVFDFSFEMTKTTNDLLAKTLKDGIAEGESIRQLQRRVETMFQDMEAYRSERIARTETASAMTFAHQEVYEESGVVAEKEWFAALDERTSDGCLSVHEEVVAVGAKFSNGLERPPLHPNCRCDVLPVVSYGKGMPPSPKDRGEIDMSSLEKEIDLALREVDLDTKKEYLDRKVKEVDEKLEGLEKLAISAVMNQEQKDAEVEKLRQLRQLLVRKLNE